MNVRIKVKSVLKGKRKWAVLGGNSRKLLRRFKPNSIDAVVCDPPYDLLQASRVGSPRRNVGNSPAGRTGSGAGGFMGLAWDATGIAFDKKFWKEVLRVLKPGGHLLAFGGTRTWHRMVCAIEDAGFEVRECYAWLYATGFPKSLNVSKAIDAKMKYGKSSSIALSKNEKNRPIIGKVKRLVSKGRRASEGTGDHGVKANMERWLNYEEKDVAITKSLTKEASEWEGWGTATKPAFEPIAVARKPLEGSVAENVLEWGTGAINVDGCRVGKDTITQRQKDMSKYHGNNLGAGSHTHMTGVTTTTTGRWPSNVLFTHHPDCECIGNGKVKSTNCNSGGKPNGRLWVDNGHWKERKPGGYADKEGTETVLVWNCVEGCPIRLLDQQSGDRSSPWIGNSNDGAKGGKMFGGSEQSVSDKPEYRDSGGASRFYFQSKASPSERHEGCRKLFWRHKNGELVRISKRKARKLQKRGETVLKGNMHPTVKPVQLLRYLCRLVTPKGGVVLDPFNGSGSTGVAALQEQFRYVGIEMMPQYRVISRLRLRHHSKKLKKHKSSKDTPDEIPLFN